MSMRARLPCTSSQRLPATTSERLGAGVPATRHLLRSRCARLTHSLHLGMWPSLDLAHLPYADSGSLRPHARHTFVSSMPHLS